MTASKGGTGNREPAIRVWKSSLSAAAAYHPGSLQARCIGCCACLPTNRRFSAALKGPIPEAVVEILVRSQLPCSAPEGDDFTQDGGHLPAGRDSRLQISRNVDLWDAVQRVEEAGIGRNVGAHRLAFLSSDMARGPNPAPVFGSVIRSLTRSYAPTAGGRVDGSGHARNEFAGRCLDGCCGS